MKIRLENGRPLADPWLSFRFLLRLSSPIERTWSGNERALSTPIYQSKEHNHAEDFDVWTIYSNIYTFLISHFSWFVKQAFTIANQLQTFKIVAFVLDDYKMVDWDSIDWLFFSFPYLHVLLYTSLPPLFSPRYPFLNPLKPFPFSHYFLPSLSTQSYSKSKLSHGIRFPVLGDRSLPSSLSFHPDYFLWYTYIRVRTLLIEGNYRWGWG